MFSKFFINRPIFATVLSIVVIIAGLMAIRGLPIEEYPQVTPPQVTISATYVGANAETISKTANSFGRTWSPPPGSAWPAPIAVIGAARTTRPGPTGCCCYAALTL